MRNKVLPFVIVILIVLCIFPANVLGANATISADDNNYNLAAHSHANGDTITIGAGRTVTLVGDSGTTYANFKIVCGAGVHLTLSNVNIDNSSFADACPLSFTGSGNTLVLAAGTTNALAGGDQEPAVRVEDTSELTISGSGTLNAQSGIMSAGIGGGYNRDAGAINITGGNITASAIRILSTVTGAGIGGGAHGGGGTITISGGTVNTINNGGGGASIGGGYSGSAGTVTITGGTVTASSIDGFDIGSGKDGGSDGGTLNLDGAADLTMNSSGTNVAVTLGDVHITDNSSNSYTLADGYYVDGALFTGTVINITDGSITGSGASYTDPVVTISDASRDYLIAGSTTANLVVVSAGTTAATDVTLFGATITPGAGCAFDISGSNVNLGLAGSSTLHSNGSYAALHCAPGAEVTISGDGTLTAESARSGAGIGGHSGESGGKITIQSGTVNVFGNKNTGYNGGAGIGGGNAGSGGTILISGGTVTVKSEGPHNDEGGSAAIGGGEDGGAGSITISGGTVTATAGNEYGSGIGCGHTGTGGSISISAGTVTATAGRVGEAGIGGRGDTNVTISGGTVQANGRYNGAGIGGRSSDFDITISDGTVTASTAGGGAGIGGQDAFSVGQITITGGTVMASSGSGGAGIGNGEDGEYYDSAGTIEISGGNITAQGSDGGAGIGGGHNAGAGTMTISGGVVYATGSTGAYDIGSGQYNTTGTLAISGSAAVFLATDSCITPATTTHTHLEYTEDTEESYGYAIPSAWTPTFGAYLRLATLSYNGNGGSGTAPASVTQLYNTTAAVSNGSALSRTYYTLSGWNTAANGSGTAYSVGGTFTFTANTTLYAQWLAHPELTSSVADGKIYTGGRVTLTPNISGGTWSWDKDYLSATFNSPATFTGLKAGTTTITYTVGGVRTTYKVTIEKSKLPSTGQNFTLFYLILSGAVAAGSAALLFSAMRKGTNR